MDESRVKAIDELGQILKDFTKAVAKAEADGVYPQPLKDLTELLLENVKSDDGLFSQLVKDHVDGAQWRTDMIAYLEKLLASHP